MQQVIRKRSFQVLINTMHIVTKIAFVGCSAVVGIFTILMALIGITSNEKLIALLSKGEVSASIRFAGVHIELSELAVSNFTFVKGPVLLLLLLFIIYLILFWLIIFYVHSMLKAIRNDQVFTVKNSKYIEWIGYCVIVMSFVLQPIHAGVFSLFGQLFQLTDALQNSEWVQSVSIHYFSIHWSLLFSGMIIWIIGRVFKYGAFLQEEFDATI